MRKMLTAVALTLLVVGLDSRVTGQTEIGTKNLAPIIVAKGKLVNQTGPISPTTIFTPTHTGLYRISIYMTMTQPGSGWEFNFTYTDDAGVENAGRVNGTGAPIELWPESSPPTAYAYNNGVTAPGIVLPFEAVAGTPVSYTVVPAGSGSGNSVYSLYYVIENLD